jgi:hypothetical protein
VAVGHIDHAVAVDLQTFLEEVLFHLDPLAHLDH